MKHSEDSHDSYDQRIVEQMAQLKSLEDISEDKSATDHERHMQIDCSECVWKIDRLLITNNTNIKDCLDCVQKINQLPIMVNWGFRWSDH